MLDVSQTAPLRLSDHHRPVAAHRWILAAAWAIWCTGFYSLTLLSFLLPPIQKAFGASEGDLATLTAVGVGMTGVGGLLFGWMSDRLGRRLAMAVSIAAFSLGNAACAFAPGFGWLLAARALVGLGVGGSWGAGQAMLGETIPPALRGQYGAIAQTGAPAGLGLATIVGSFVAPVLGWRTVFLLSAAPLLMLLAWSRLQESDLWLEHRRRLGAGEVPHARTPILAQLVGADLAGIFTKAFLLTLLNMSAYWFAVSWLPRYLQKERGLSIFGSGWWTLTFVAGSLLGYLSFGRVSDTIGRRLAFALYSTVTALGLVMVTLLWGLVATRPAVGLACMLVAGVGTGTWSCYGPYFSELFPTRVRGSAMSILMNVSRGVQFVAPLVIAGAAARWGGLAGGVALAAGFAALAGLWVWTLPETAGARIEV
ncbi:MAG TPA: MFS transporter [Thermoanaerobaculia bacterium]